jgi:hypothetical protein
MHVKNYINKYVGEGGIDKGKEGRSWHLNWSLEDLQGNMEGPESWP